MSTGKPAKFTGQMTTKYAELELPQEFDALELGELRAFINWFSDVAGDAGLEIWADGKRVEYSLSLKAVDE